MNLDYVAKEVKEEADELLTKVVRMHLDEGEELPDVIEIKLTLLVATQDVETKVSAKKIHTVN